MSVVELYNEPMKMEYITENYPNLKTAGRIYKIFERTADLERKLGKDIAQFSDQELSEAFTLVSAASQITNVKRSREIQSYFLWCSDHGVSNVSSIKELDVDTIERFRARMIHNPGHLARVLDTLFPAPETEHIYFICRAYYWLAFLGLYEDEAANLVTSQVNLDDRIIYRDEPFHNSIVIIPEAFRDIQSATTLEALLENRNCRGVHVQTLRPRAHGDNILRGKNRKNIADMQMAITNTCRKSTTVRADKLRMSGIYLDVDLTYSFVRKSGIFYRTWRRECSTGIVSFENVVADEFLRKTYTFSETHSKARIHRELIKAYMTDYERWKKLITTD